MSSELIFESIAMDILRERVVRAREICLTTFSTLPVVASVNNSTDHFRSLAMEDTNLCAFDALFEGSFQHILENIFFSLDYKSFKACCEVSKQWRVRLMTERFYAHFHMEISEDEEELIMASIRGDVEVARQLLSSGLVNVNCLKGDPTSETRVSSMDGVGATPLHWAGQNGHTELAMLLLDRGANPETKCSWGQTPLHKSAEFGHTDLVKLLLGRGADPNGMDKWEQTPLHLAANSGHNSVAKLLIEKGADLEAKDVKGRTPLYRVMVYYTDTGLIKLLLDKGADPNKGAEGPYSSSPTPLHFAAKFGDREVVELLMERGARPNGKDHNGKTPLHWAAIHGMPTEYTRDLMRILVRGGANPFDRDKDGNDAIDLFLQRKTLVLELCQEILEARGEDFNDGPAPVFLSVSDLDQAFEERQDRTRPRGSFREKCSWGMLWYCSRILPRVAFSQISSRYTRWLCENERQVESGRDEDISFWS